MLSSDEELQETKRTRPRAVRRVIDDSCDDDTTCVNPPSCPAHSVNIRRRSAGSLLRRRSRSSSPSRCSGSGMNDAEKLSVVDGRMAGGTCVERGVRKRGNDARLKGHPALQSVRRIPTRLDSPADSVLDPSTPMSRSVGRCMGNNAMSEVSDPPLDETTENEVARCTTSSSVVAPPARLLRQRPSLKRVPQRSSNDLRSGVLAPAESEYDPGPWNIPESASGWPLFVQRPPPKPGMNCALNKFKTCHMRFAGERVELDKDGKLAWFDRGCQVRLAGPFTQDVNKTAFPSRHQNEDSDIDDPSSKTPNFVANTNTAASSTTNTLVTAGAQNYGTARLSHAVDCAHAANAACTGTNRDHTTFQCSSTLCGADTLYFYGTHAQLSDTVKYSHSVRVDIDGRKHGMMFFENAHQRVEYKSHWKLMKYYQKEFKFKVTSGLMSNLEYKICLKHAWLSMIDQFIDKFGKERVPLQLRKAVTSAHEMNNMDPPHWPVIPTIYPTGRVHYPSEHDSYGAAVTVD